MKIYSRNIVDGYLQDPFGHRGTQFIKSKPSRSFQLGWEDLPQGTVTLALIFIDYDAIPVCGFPWIHWTVANIDPQAQELPENASLEQSLLEGVSSWASGIVPDEWKLNKEEAIGYGGCAPPDTTHQYTVKVCALDCKLNLERGFYMNELLKAMEGHILAKAKLNFLYKTQDSK